MHPHNICMKYFILLRYFLEKHALKCFERAQKQTMAKGGENICNFIALRFKIQNSQYKNKYFSSWRGRKYFLGYFSYWQFVFNLKMEEPFFSLCVSTLCGLCRLLFALLALWHRGGTIVRIRGHSKLVEDDGYLVTALGQADRLPRAQRYWVLSYLQAPKQVWCADGPASNGAYLRWC